MLIQRNIYINSHSDKHTVKPKSNYFTYLDSKNNPLTKLEQEKVTEIINRLDIPAYLITVGVKRGGKSSIGLKAPNYERPIILFSINNDEIIPISNFDTAIQSMKLPRTTQLAQEGILNKRKIMVTGGTHNKHKRTYEQQLISKYREQYQETSLSELLEVLGTLRINTNTKASLYQFKIILSYIHKIFIESYKNKPQQSTGTSALLRNMF